MPIVKLVYGCVESALGRYTIFLNKINTLGFEVNPYDLCVGNKMINGEECKIDW